MRVFRREAAEIIPHAGDNAGDLGPRKLWKGAADVAPSMSGDAEKGADPACQPASERRRPIERQKIERGEQKRRSPSRQTIGKPGRPSSNVKPSRTHRDRR
jgi:hypothetical protein